MVSLKMDISSCPNIIFTFCFMIFPYKTMYSIPQLYQSKQYENLLKGPGNHRRGKGGGIRICAWCGASPPPNCKPRVLVCSGGCSVVKKFRYQSELAAGVERTGLGMII